MANRAAHQLLGCAVGLGVGLRDTQKDSIASNPIVAGGVGALMGRLPDMLEPSLNNPHHRQFFHSITVLGAMAYGVKKAYDWQPCDDFERLVRGLVLVGGSAYLSHLAVDALTKRSLPMIGKL